MNYLIEQKNSGILPNEWSQIEDLYNKKLWHQLTLKIQEMVLKTELQSGQALIKLYENFITDFEHRINTLSLVEICLPIVRQYKDTLGNDAAIAFLEKLREKVKNENEPRILCNTSIGTIHLSEKKFEETKKIVEQTSDELNNLDGVTTVHGRFYDLASNYYRIIGNHSEYYKNALRYLGCRDFESLSATERKDRAFYLGLAAILGDDIYNFGELLMHPILESLNGTQDQWLVDLLFAFNRGDLDKFDNVKTLWAQQFDLKAAEVKMRQKICLLCLMEMAFSRPSNSRQLTFEEIAAKTKLPLNEIELLVMRALSLNLIKGLIDEIEHKVYISWVQPRVLDVNQIKIMRGKLDFWSNEVNSMIHQVQDTANEILN